MVRTKLNSAPSHAKLPSSLSSPKCFETPSPKKRPASDNSQNAEFSTPVAKVRKQEVPLSKNVIAPVKQSRLAPSTEQAESLVAEFDPKKEIWDFLYNRNLPLAFRVAARYAAATPGRQRILRCHVAFDTVPTIKVTFRGDSQKAYTEQVALWSFQQMRVFVQEFNRSLTSSGRRGTPSLNSNTIVARCPPLWWSLVLWTLGCRLNFRGKETKWTLPAATAVPLDMDDVIQALLAASDPGITSAEALSIMP